MRTRIERNERQDSNIDGRASGTPHQFADDARLADDQLQLAGPHRQVGVHSWYQVVHTHH
jgi:hypothetical protein